MDFIQDFLCMRIENTMYYLVITCLLVCVSVLTHAYVWEEAKEGC